MILLILLTSHLLADFWFQSNRMARLKNENNAILIIHALIHTATTIALGILYVFINSGLSDINLMKLFGLITLLVTYTIAHYFIDSLKHHSFYTKLFKESSYTKTYTFLLDQIIHIFSILILSAIYFFKTNNLFILSSLKMMTNLDTIFFTLCVMVTLTSVTGYIISLLFIDLSVMDKTKSKSVNTIDYSNNMTLSSVELEIRDGKELKQVVHLENTYDVENAGFGKIIGYVERTFVLLLVVSNHLEGIAILVTIKTFSRYKQLQSKEFTERYILGTLLSFAMAFALAQLFWYVIHIKGLV
ncbi:DUF3307 domain-containing protein [Erysipelothrix aquatica]|uniref:DUF3307 domain-containing protein n=1 Tax=Erysipelothrix aquatica TaxID=2683714 RepID=UPI001356BA17|nr:DUF3307 domain-containing protein [Erysipelothrix aquatica]